MELEKRVLELEEKSAYQEHLLQQLNGVMIEQQQQIDALESGMQQLKAYVQSAGEQGARVAEVDAPPPHY